MGLLAKTVGIGRVGSGADASAVALASTVVGEAAPDSDAGTQLESINAASATGKATLPFVTISHL